MERLPKQRYTREFKEAAVGMVMNEKVRVAEAAERLQIPAQTLTNWMRKVEANGIETTKRKWQVVSELESENSRLKKELAQAQMERDILKKATAYFAKESGRGTRS